ncbi:hypothetical protein [Streptomyces sp. N35]|uniref:hypothetical protein n=1 Tax=Streptomyces sp. N35 TaxID=2795730 RepID=UPI0018F38F68|nr:hypothetical protein [Streptomyces sp. N35]
MHTPLHTPGDRVTRPGPLFPVYGTVLTVGWDPFTGQARYYVHWDGTTHARPYTAAQITAAALAAA